MTVAKSDIMQRLAKKKKSTKKCEGEDEEMKGDVLGYAYHQNLQDSCGKLVYLLTLQVVWIFSIIQSSLLVYIKLVTF